MHLTNYSMYVFLSSKDQKMWFMFNSPLPAKELGSSHGLYK